MKWQHHNCTLSLTNGLYHYNVVSRGVPFHPYNTQEDIVECSSRTSECPPDFCFKRILGLKSIRPLTQFAPDLLACQFAMPNWVQLNCDLAVAYMWLFDPIPCAEVSECISYMSWKANYCSPWTWMSEVVISIVPDHGSVGQTGWAAAAGWVREC